MGGEFYTAVATAIFVFVSINFLFPCNQLIPLGNTQHLFHI